jgi:hypothetical protein
MKLQFQYLDDTGPYAFYNMSESAYEQVRPWKNAITNPFTTIEQILSIHMQYIKLSKNSELGGVRLSILDDSKSPVLHKPQINYNVNANVNSGCQWPFKPLSMSESNHEFSLFRNDRRYKSWKNVIGKSYAKSIPFISGVHYDQDGNLNNEYGILDYFVPKWILNLFVPIGIQRFFSWHNLKLILGRNEHFEINNYNYNKNKNLQTINLLDSATDFQNFKTLIFSTGFIHFESELNPKEMLGTSLLVELDMCDVFVISAYAKLDYVLNGVRWWVYWWPGLSFIIGVLFIWIISSIGCLGVSWFGYICWSMYISLNESKNNKINKTDNIHDDDDEYNNGNERTERNLPELQKD